MLDGKYGEEWQNPIKVESWAKKTCMEHVFV